MVFRALGADAPMRVPSISSSTGVEGSRITRLKPVQGFCAETAGAMTLYLATSLRFQQPTRLRVRGPLGRRGRHYDRVACDTACRRSNRGPIL